MAVNGADDGLGIGAVADGPAGFHDGARQGRLRHDHSGPYRVLDLVLAHGAVPLLDQVEQQGEYQGLERHDLAIATQFAPVVVELAVVEVDHAG